MALELYYHPLASFCHKVLIALYESGTAFTPEVVDLADKTEKQELLDIWPVGKMPVLRDSRRDVVIPETSIIIEYLDQHYPSQSPLLPADVDAQLQARLWDRFFDNYVQLPMQTIVTNRIRQEVDRSSADIEQAKSILSRCATDHGPSEMRLRSPTALRPRRCSMQESFSPFRPTMRTSKPTSSGYSHVGRSIAF